MRFRFVEEATLPRLAWCARIAPGSDEVVVSCGRDVETGPRSFVEGAWKGPFAGSDPAAASVVCGTGGVLRPDAVAFVASSDRLSPLFSVVAADARYVSNSPVFAASAAEATPDPSHPYDTYDLLALWRAGRFAPDGTLPLAGGRRLHVHMGVILVADRSGAIRFETHPPSPVPHDFAAYRNLLAGSLESLVANAADGRRKLAYRPLAMISSGYDSTATAALAARAGCREALTFLDSERPDPAWDSGAANAERLGLSCRAVDRWAYRSEGGGVEREFALLARATAAPLASAEAHLPGRLLVGGYLGDSIWQKGKCSVRDEQAIPWSPMASGLSQFEFRLRVGYQVVAAPTIGVEHNRAIAAIEASQEMRPWSIGGDYDRPLPRRIAEEAGLPRESFGTRNRASGHADLMDEAGFSRQGLADYERFRADLRARVPSVQRLRARLAVAARHGLWRTVGTTRKRVVPSTRLQRRFPFLLNAHPHLIPWRFLFTFQWAFESLEPRYRLSPREPLAPTSRPPRERGQAGG